MATGCPALYDTPCNTDLTTSQLLLLFLEQIFGCQNNDFLTSTVKIAKGDFNILENTYIL